MRIYLYKGKANIIGKRVREARKEKGYKQKDLVVKLDLLGKKYEQDVVSRIENGHRFVTDYELLLLSRILGKSVEWFLQDEIAELDKEQEL